MTTAALVLAGGRSARMGADKALLALNGRPLLAWVLERLAPQADALAINTNAPPDAFAAFGYPVLPDTIPGFAGPLAGVLAGLDWAAAHHDTLLTAAVDTPFLPLDLRARLGAPGGPAVATSANRPHPVFALWPVALREPLRVFLAYGGTGRVRTFLDQVGFTPVPFPLAPAADGFYDPFTNLNTPDDLARAEAIAAALP